MAAFGGRTFLLAVLLPLGTVLLASRVENTGTGAEIPPIGPPPPSVSSLPATVVSSTGAILNGSLDPYGLAADVRFEWGKDNNAAAFDNTPPAVATLAAALITTSGAVIAGDVNPNALDTQAWFEWGTDDALASFGSTPVVDLGAGTVSRNVSAALIGLRPWTVYYYRVAAVNGAGLQRGAVRSFSTGDYYVAIGDSITMGMDDNTAWDDVSRDGRNSGGGFEPVLNDLLTAARGYPHTVVNEGVNGHTAADGLAFLTSSILARHPAARYYLILYGTNDSNEGVPSGKGLKPGDRGYTGSYKDTLQRIISVIAAAGKTPLPAKVPPTLFADRNVPIQEYNAVIDELMAANGIAVVPPDLYSFFAANPLEMALPDVLHPNGEGYRSVARLWFEALSRK